MPEKPHKQRIQASVSNDRLGFKNGDPETKAEGSPATYIHTQIASVAL